MCVYSIHISAFSTVDQTRLESLRALLNCLYNTAAYYDTDYFEETHDLIYNLKIFTEC